MNRKQLEECAWKKTPNDERRAQKERYDWTAKKTITERLKGNNREVLVFDPSGDTPGTMSPWVPLWSLYSDELEQRCKEEREPKLRAPYNRTRSDYTGDVESSPGGTRTAAGRSGPAHHATKKKSPAQLDREIAEALTSKIQRRVLENVYRGKVTYAGYRTPEEYKALNAAAETLAKRGLLEKPATRGPGLHLWSVTPFGQAVLTHGAFR